MKSISEYCECTECSLGFDDSLWSRCPRCGNKDNSIGFGNYGNRPLPEDSHDAMSTRNPDEWFPEEEAEA